MMEAGRAGLDDTADEAGRAGELDGRRAGLDDGRRGRDRR